MRIVTATAALMACLATTTDAAERYIDIANRKHLLASALAAHVAGSQVRIRWEDSGVEANRMVALLTRE